MPTARRRIDLSMSTEPIDSATKDGEEVTLSRADGPGETPLVLRLDESFRGLRLDAALAQAQPDLSRSRLTQLIKKGQILVDGAEVRPRHVIVGGESVRILLPAPQPDIERAEDISLSPVYVDEHVLVIDKQAGLTVHPGAGTADGTLLNGLLHHYPAQAQLPRAGIVHRLDKDTSGLMMIARTELAHRVLVAALGARDVHRRYLALVQGVPTAGGKIDEPIGRHARHRTKMAVVSGGRDAVTHYTVRRRYTRFALLDVRLETGRTHQIRVHLAHIGYPIAGDPTYGGRARPPAGLAPMVAERLRQIGRQALHACELSFVHPATEERMTFTADPPVDMTQLIAALENYDKC